LRRALLNLANSVLRPLGVQLYREGMDMRSVLARLAQRNESIGTVVDIGASDGRWSAQALPLFPAARFIGIDPLAERAAALGRLKRREPRFDYELCAAGALEEDTVELAVTADLDGSTVGGAGQSRRVPSRSIDRILRDKGCRGPFLLKFDTHGFEVPILAGAAATLAGTHFIVMEVYNYRHVSGTLLFHEMCRLLDGHGFRCFNMADPLQRPLDGCLWQMDLFYARHDHEFFRENSFRHVEGHG
jgi:FkbM family methyltransferase